MRAEVSKPVNFAIDALTAVRLASEQAHIKCNHIFQQLVYADDENYYFVLSVFGPPGTNKSAVIIDGKTGRVTDHR